MLSLRRLVIAVCLLLAGNMAQAHGYWIETEGTHKVNAAVAVKLFFGDYAMGEKLSGETLNKMKDIKVYVATPDGQQQELAMKQEADYWVGSFVPGTQGSYIITGINDQRDVQDWTKHNLGIVRPVQYLKAVYHAGKPSGRGTASILLDLTAAATKKNGYNLQVLKGGSPIAAQEVVVAPFKGGEKFLATDKDGKVSVTPEKPGQYILSVEWIDKTPGEYKDKKYETVRHRLDYTLVHE